jgi:hypothetical protein
MGDDWWNARPSTMVIYPSPPPFLGPPANPALPAVAHSRQVRADFRRVLTLEDADAQIASAMIYIAAHTDGVPRPLFAYPCSVTTTTT